jgi:hypothetical protein
MELRRAAAREPRAAAASRAPGGLRLAAGRGELPPGANGARHDPAARRLDHAGHSRNALLLSIPSGRLLGEYELAPLRRYEFERVLARELVRSGLFEAVVTDPARATRELRGRVDFQREHRVHFMGLGLLWWPLFYWVPSSTQLDRCEGRYELVRRADGALLHAADFRVEERELVLDRLGNETLLTSLGARILPQVIQDIVRELAALEAP